MVHETVVRDRVQPGGELCLNLVAPACLDRPHPDLLVELFRDRPVADTTQDEAEELSLVPLVELLEGAGIAFAVREHQLFVAGLHYLPVYAGGSVTNPGNGFGAGLRGGTGPGTMPRASRLR